MPKSRLKKNKNILYMKKYQLSCGSRIIEIGRRTLIMGIINITPDSFSDGGKFLSVESAVAQGEKLVKEGADILDIGGESTRPFASAVSLKSELSRILPVIEKLAARVNVPISIDTTKAEVADQAIKVGASIINDISAMRDDPEMAGVVKKNKVPIILMHMQGTPKNMQINPSYADLLAEIKSFLAQAVEKAVQSGIKRSQIIIDPGIGFGKTGHHNLLLLKDLIKLSELDLPVLIGSSRKRFIRDLLKPETQKDIDPLRPEVETGTQATLAAAVLNGAQLVRVHDVAETVITLKIIDAIKGA